MVTFPVSRLTRAVKTVPSGPFAMWTADVDINSLSVFTAGVRVRATAQSCRWRPDARAAVAVPTSIPSHVIKDEGCNTCWSMIAMPLE